MLFKYFIYNIYFFSKIFIFINIEYASLNLLFFYKSLFLFSSFKQLSNLFYNPKFFFYDYIFLEFHLLLIVINSLSLSFIF
jgi:hypothetical protein